jgi:hypothetical protein
MVLVPKRLYVFAYISFVNNITITLAFHLVKDVTIIPVGCHIAETGRFYSYFSRLSPA